MRITEVRTVLLTGPSSGADPFLLGFKATRSAAFIEILTDTELTGLGETCVGYHLPEIVPGIVDFYAPILVGLEDDEINPRRLWDRMNNCALFWSRTGLLAGVLAGIEGALWDLRGKMLGVPVHALLGGRVHERLLCYATGNESPYPWDELLRKVDLHRAAGFIGAKYASGWYDHQTGRSFESDSVQAWVDIESNKLERLRQHVGKDFILCLDGHMGNVDEGKKCWDVAIASSVLRALEKFDIFFFEEPLSYYDLSGYAELCRVSSIPVAGGEVLTTRDEFRPWADAGAFDIAQPDASTVGVFPFLDIARQFAVRRKRVATHCWTAGPGTMQNIHAAFATPNMAILEIPPLPGGLHTDVYGDGYRFEHGYILPPEAPGLGVRLTEAARAKYRFVPGTGEWNLVPGKHQYYDPQIDWAQR
jgi:L-alanine-DL-glutamate epimerase-like enolase superfamily enzyme